MTGEPPSFGVPVYAMADDHFRPLRWAGFVVIPIVLLTLPLSFQIHLMVLAQGGDDTFVWLGFSSAMLLGGWFPYRWMLVPEPLVIYESAIVPTERPFLDRRGRAIPFHEILEIRAIPMNRRPERERFILKDTHGKEYYVDFLVIARYVRRSELQRARAALDAVLPAIRRATGGAAGHGSGPA